jgi:ribosomal protein S18 acetylase RimI-like enzyme
MKNIVHFEPITPEVYKSYIEVGTKAYNQHYRHLWPAGKTYPYINNSFTHEVLKKEANDENTLLYRIIYNQKPVGILKFTINASTGTFSEEEALYIDKIYILNEYSGKGIGKKALQFVILRAKEIGKTIVWLDSMQKGPALNFYLKNGFEIHSESQVTFPTVLESEKLMWVMVKQID